jgi:hypothetical protein
MTLKNELPDQYTNLPAAPMYECWVFNSEGVKHLIATLYEAPYTGFVH